MSILDIIASKLSPDAWLGLATAFAALGWMAAFALVGSAGVKGGPR